MGPGGRAALRRGRARGAAFARAATAQPSAVTGAVAARLRAHWSDAEIVEILGVAEIFDFLNRWNDAMGSALEDLPRAAGEARLALTGWHPCKHG